MDCIFCKIVAGELPATIVRSDERTVAFMDINPGSRGHCLVIPRAHAADLTEIPPTTSPPARWPRRISPAARWRASAPEGVNLINSCRAAAWQTVFHFHIHVMPRYADDGLRLPWTPAPPTWTSCRRPRRALRG